MLAKDRDQYRLSMRTFAGPSGFRLPCTQVASNLETIEKLISEGKPGRTGKEGGVSP